MKCEVCRKEIGDDQNFCGYCGARVIRDSDADTASNPTENETTHHRPNDTHTESEYNTSLGNAKEIYNKNQKCQSSSDDDYKISGFGQFFVIVFAVLAIVCACSEWFGSCTIFDVSSLLNRVNSFTGSSDAEVYEVLFGFFGMACILLNVLLIIVALCNAKVIKTMAVLALLCSGVLLFAYFSAMDSLERDSFGLSSWLLDESYAPFYLVGCSVLAIVGTCLKKTA